MLICAESKGNVHIAYSVDILPPFIRIYKITKYVYFDIIYLTIKDFTMRYKCCDHILGSIDLSFSGFKYCNEVWEGPEYIHYSEENAFQKNEERRLKIIEEMKNGIIPERCKLCPILEEKDWKEFDGKIHKITIFNWKHCNAACFYCSVHSDSTFPFFSPS